MENKEKRPDLTWVRDELAPINEEDRKNRLKVWNELIPKFEDNKFGKLYITGTADGKD